MFRHDKIMHKSHLLKQLNAFAAILTSLPFFACPKTTHTDNRERESSRQVCYKYDMALCEKHRRHIIVKDMISASNWRIQYGCKNRISNRKRENQRTEANGRFALSVFTHTVIHRHQTLLELFSYTYYLSYVYFIVFIHTQSIMEIPKQIPIPNNLFIFIDAAGNNNQNVSEENGILQLQVDLRNFERNKILNVAQGAYFRQTMPPQCVHVFFLI